MHKIVPVLLVLLMGCGGDEQDIHGIPDGATILAIGDSLLDWNRDDEAAIPDVIGQELEEVAYNASISGAYFLGDDGIPGQYVDSDWEWIVLDGGGNDFNDVCGCGDCADLMDEIIAEDGISGELPDFVDDVTGQGFRVIMFGYYSMPPTAQYGFANCNDAVDTYSQRQQLLAQSNENVWFVDGRQIVDPNDLTLYDDDHVHPSELGSRLIGQAIAAQILIAQE